MFSYIKISFKVLPAICRRFVFDLLDWSYLLLGDTWKLRPKSCHNVKSLVSVEKKWLNRKKANWTRGRGIRYRLNILNILLWLTMTWPPFWRISSQNDDNQYIIKYHNNLQLSLRLFLSVCFFGHFDYVTWSTKMRWYEIIDNQRWEKIYPTLYSALCLLV